MPITAPVTSEQQAAELRDLMEASIWIALVTSQVEDTVWSCR